MDTRVLAFVHDSFRAYFCAEALLEQGYLPRQDLAGERYEDAIRFLHDLTPPQRIHTPDDLLTQLQQTWTYALHLHERYDPHALDVITQVQTLFDTHAALLQSQPAEAQQWQRDIRRQRGRSLYKFLGDFRAALDVYALNYQERQAAGDALGAIRELSAAAKVFHDTYDFAAALTLTERCCAFWEEALRDPTLSPEQVNVLTDGWARSLGALGETLCKLQEFAGAAQCFEDNRRLMGRIAGDVARAALRLADCAMEHALHMSEGDQGAYLTQAAHCLHQAEPGYQEHSPARGFFVKSQARLWLLQQRWADVIALVEQALPTISLAFLTGYLRFYQGQALLALGATEAADTALAASATAFAAEHHTLEAAGVQLAQSAAQWEAGGDGLPSFDAAVQLIQAFQSQYSALRTVYFHEEITRWWPASLATLAQHFPGLAQRVTGPLASAAAFFAHVETSLQQVRTALASLHLSGRAKGVAVRQLIRTVSLL